MLKLFAAITLLISTSALANTYGSGIDVFPVCTRDNEGATHMYAPPEGNQTELFYCHNGNWQEEAPQTSSSTSCAQEIASPTGASLNETVIAWCAQFGSSRGDNLDRFTYDYPNFFHRSDRDSHGRPDPGG